MSSLHIVTAARPGSGQSSAPHISDCGLGVIIILWTHFQGLMSVCGQVSAYPRVRVVTVWRGSGH